MNLFEASRLYQAELERDRRVRHEFEGILSADDIREESAQGVEAARAALFNAWMLNAACLVM